MMYTLNDLKTSRKTDRKKQTQILNKDKGTLKSYGQIRFM